MKYLDKYPSCNGCPVAKYCGTIISSVKLCNSYDYAVKHNRDKENKVKNSKITEK